MGESVTPVLNVMGPVFEEFDKIARLSRECVVTEKIDGTNGCVYIADDAQPITLLAGRVVPFMVGSRTRWISRWIFPEADNYGFARWAYEHAAEMLTLGPGRHFGEWWGQGIQRNYSQTRKRFSLFNVARWADERDRDKFPTERPACCDVVPILYRGPFDEYGVMKGVKQAMARLQSEGSAAAPGFMRPEGVVVWHEAARILFKKTLEKDESPKGVS